MPFRGYHLLVPSPLKGESEREFLFVILFHLVTLPVEFNASNRALQQMRVLDLVDEEDYIGSRAVLRAAAMTYVAALATAVANLLRILMISGRRR